MLSYKGASNLLIASQMSFLYLLMLNSGPIRKFRQHPDDQNRPSIGCGRAVVIESCTCSRGSDVNLLSSSR